MSLIHAHKSLDFGGITDTVDAQKDDDFHRLLSEAEEFLEAITGLNLTITVTPK